MTATATKERTKAVTLDVKKLKDALTCVNKAVPGKTPRPILHNVLLADGWLTATDLELRIDCKIDYSGPPLLLPAKRLGEILTNSVGPTVRIKPEGSLCVVSIGKSEWRLPTEDAAEFPASTPEGTHLVCRMPSDQCRRAISSVVYATDSESSRYALGSVLLEVSRKDGRIWFVATDGRRLSCATVRLGSNQDPDDQSPLIPDSAMKIISDMLPKNSQVEFLSNGRELVANMDYAVVTARLVEGRFPHWRDVCKPVPGATTHLVNLASLLRATKAAKVVTSEQSKGVTYTFSKSMITLSAQSSEAGESSVECEVSAYGRDGFVKLDPTFVVQVCEALSRLDGEPDVSISLNGPGDAVCIKYGEDGEYQSVIMPLAE